MSKNVDSAAHRHRRAVLLLDRGEIAEVDPLHRLAGVASPAPRCRSRSARHLLQLFERPDLLGELLAQPDDLLGRVAVVELGLLALLVVDEEIHAVERHAAVVADDAAAAVVVRQPGDDVRDRALPDVGRVGVEDAVVVGLAVLGEDLGDAFGSGS